MIKITCYLFVFALLLVPKGSFGQISSLGSAANFALFTSSGSVSNTGISTITGDVGSDLGAITGFGASYNADATTELAKLDLSIAHDLLLSEPASNTAHTAVFGAGETLTSGRYAIVGAGSISDTLFLDGENDTSAVFIFRFTGALTVAASSVVVLINDARPCNVYWVSEGAISIGASSKLKGAFIANLAAVSVGAGCEIEGHVLSTGGAVAINNTIINVPICVGTTISYTPPPVCCHPDFGSTINFAMYTNAGVVTNTGMSTVIGNVGSDYGAILGFGAAAHDGSLESANAITELASIDLLNFYSDLMSIPITNNTHAAAFGGSEILYSGVYYVGGAGSLADTLFLDAQGDSNALFVFRYLGAFSVAINAVIVTQNSLPSCSVFFVSEGAMTMGASTDLSGTFLANNGAIVMGANSNLKGRLFSTSGAITFNSSVVSINDQCLNTAPVGLPVELVSFTSQCTNNSVELEWSTATELNNDYFTISRSLDGIEWEIVAEVDGMGTSNSLNHYSFTDNEPTAALTYYKLKQTDMNGAIKDYKTISQDACQVKESELFIYPNPVRKTLNVSYSGDKDVIISTSIYNLVGERVYFSEFYEPKIILESNFKGVYILELTLASNILIEKFVVADE